MTKWSRQRRLPVAPRARHVTGHACVDFSTDGEFSTTCLCVTERWAPSTFFISFFFFVRPMISKFLILMSMTCVETVGNDSNRAFSMLRPSLLSVSLNYDHSIDFSLSRSQWLFTSRRSLPSLLHTTGDASFRGRNFHAPQALVLFHGCLVHVLYIVVKPNIGVSQSKYSDREHSCTRIYQIVL